MQSYPRDQGSMHQMKLCLHQYVIRSEELYALMPMTKLIS